jgi:hypothetical protein
VNVQKSANVLGLALFLALGSALIMATVVVWAVVS